MGRPKPIVISQGNLLGGSDWAGVFPYPSHGKRYYRLQWGSGDKILGCMHIPGGACGNPVVEARRLEVARQLKTGRAIADVQRLIRSWGRGRKKSK